MLTLSQAGSIVQLMGRGAENVNPGPRPATMIPNQRR